MIIDQTVYTGRPADERLEKEMKCYELLDGLGIEYRRVDHEHADTIEACHAVEKLLEAEICKNLFLTNRQQTDFYLLLMPGDKPFKTKRLSKQLGVSRLSFATAEHMEKYLNITPGSVSVLGLMNDRGKAVRLVMDSELLKAAYFACHPCINSSSIRFTTKELLEKVLPALGHEATFVELPWKMEE